MPLPVAVGAAAGFLGKQALMYAALAGTDYVINHASRQAVDYAVKKTYKRQMRMDRESKAFKVARTIQKGYYSRAGQTARGFLGYVAGGAVQGKIRKHQKAQKRKKMAAKQQRTPSWEAD